MKYKSKQFRDADRLYELLLYQLTDVVHVHDWEILHKKSCLPESRYSQTIPRVQRAIRRRNKMLNKAIANYHRKYIQ